MVKKKARLISLATLFFGWAIDLLMLSFLDHSIAQSDCNDETGSPILHQFWTHLHLNVTADVNDVMNS
jgi:hypothetical protein